jgi:hypothetical protein
MYNGFGAYPADDMDMGVNSYFGESDTNFFGDTSNDSFFGEGCDFTGFGNGEFFNESAGFTTDGSEVISENAGFSTDGSNFFVEGGGFLGDAEPVPRGPKTTTEITSNNISAKSGQKPQKNSEEDSEYKRLRGRSMYNYGSKDQVLDDAMTVAQSTKNNPDPKKRITDENGKLKQSFRDALNKQTETAGRREQRISQIGNNKR